MNSGYKRFLNRRKWETNLGTTFSLQPTPDTTLAGTHSFQIEIFLQKDAEIGFWIDPYGTRAATASFFLNYVYTGAPQTYKFIVPGLTSGDYSFRTTVLTSTFSNEFGAFYEGGSFEPNIEFEGKGPYFEPVLDLASCPTTGQNIVLGTPSLTTNVTTTFIGLTWSQVNFSTGYLLQRSTDSINWNTLTTTNANSSSYQDTSFNPATTYYYRVKAVGNGNMYIDSGYTQSSVVSGSKKLQTPIIAVGTVTQTSIQLVWVDIIQESYYIISRSNELNGTYSQVGTFSSTNYTDTGLTSSTFYHYKLLAKGTGNFLDSDQSQISIKTL